MLMDMNSKIQYPYLGYLLRGRVDKAEQVQQFECHTFQIGGWNFFILRFFSRRIRNAIKHNICLSLVKNIPYIVFVGKMKYYKIEHYFLIIKLIACKSIR